MRRTFAYEFRRNLLPLVIFCVVAAGISMAYTFTATLGHFNRFEEYYEFRPVDSAIGVFTAILCVLATIVPILQFSYRMKQRSADLWYSLPVSRTKLTLVRVLEGLVLVFVPYTLAYWLGVAGVALQGMEFAYIHYLSYYALSLPLGVGLFGALSFIFSRANTVADGIMFLILWACLFPLIILVCLSDVTLFEADIASELPEYLSRYSGLEVSGYFFPYSALSYSAGAFEAIIFGQEVAQVSEIALCFAVPLAVVEGIAGYVGLFVRADRDRAENAGQISSSWLGYRVLIPAYIVLLLGCVAELMDGEIVMYVLVVLIGAALCFAYRRTFRLKIADIICLVVSITAGIILAVILFYCT